MSKVTAKEEEIEINNFHYFSEEFCFYRIKLYKINNQYYVDFFGCTPEITEKYGEWGLFLCSYELDTLKTDHQCPEYVKENYHLNLGDKKGCIRDVYKFISVCESYIKVFEKEKSCQH